MTNNFNKSNYVIDISTDNGEPTLYSNKEYEFYLDDFNKKVYIIDSTKSKQTTYRLNYGDIFIIVYNEIINDYKYMENELNIKGHSSTPNSILMFPLFNTFEFEEIKDIVNNHKISNDNLNKLIDIADENFNISVFNNEIMTYYKGKITNFITYDFINSVIKTKTPYIHICDNCLSLYLKTSKNQSFCPICANKYKPNRSLYYKDKHKRDRNNKTYEYKSKIILNRVKNRHNKDYIYYYDFLNNLLKNNEIIIDIDIISALDIVQDSFRSICESYRVQEYKEIVKKLYNDYKKSAEKPKSITINTFISILKKNLTRKTFKNRLDELYEELDKRFNKQSSSNVIIYRKDINKLFKHLGINYKITNEKIINNGKIKLVKCER